MSHSAIYNEIPDEILNTNNTQAKEFVSDFLKSTVPSNDFCPEKFEKSILLLKPPLKPKPKPHVKKSLLSRKEKIKLKLLKCPKTGWNYEEFMTINSMWNSYMREILKKTYVGKSITDIECSDMTQFYNILRKADYHGAEMIITRAKNPSLVGLRGICIIDTKNTFKILSKDNKCRTVPKNDCVFQILTGDYTLTVFGKYLSGKPAERATKKCKSRIILDL